MVNKATIVNLLRDNGFTYTNENTNNAWGFGGAIKQVYDLGTGYSIHIGLACYRHLKAAPFINLRPNDNYFKQETDTNKILEAIQFAIDSKTLTPNEILKKSIERKLGTDSFEYKQLIKLSI